MKQIVSMGLLLLLTLTSSGHTQPAFWGASGAAPGAGTGDALTTQPLSQFAATTSAQLLGVISDEVGTGALSFSGISGLANPTGSVGLTAVNGTAITAMRSDGAPALDQGIIPTWTGRHTWATAAGTGTIAPAITYTGAAHTALTASTERFDIQWNSARTIQWATGALTTQRFHVWQAPTLGFVGASTVTDTCTVCITGAPISGTNATLTNTHAVLIQAGAVTAAGTAYGLTVNAPTGATVNYAAQFVGGSVNITGTSGLIFGAASASGALLKYNGAAGQLIVRRGDDGAAGLFVSTSAANQLAGITTLTTLTGPVITAANTAGGALTVSAPRGTGAGAVGTLSIQASTAKHVTGGTNHPISAVMTFGHTQAAHPGASGAVIDAPAVTWTDFVTANSGTAAVATAYAFQQPTIAANGTSVTTTKASTVSITNAPTAGTNQTLTTTYALDVVAGAVRIGDLTTTGAATGKTVVCVDTTTGKLYASTSGVACAN